MLVHPVSRNSELRHLVHLAGTNSISSGLPSGPITVVCSDWYMLNLGIAMKSLKRPGRAFHSEWIAPTVP